MKKDKEIWGQWPPGDVITGDDKSNIIYSKKVKSIVNDLFPGVLNEDEPHNYNNFFSSPWVFLETNKVMFLYSSKGGSSIINNLIIQPHNDTNEIKISDKPKLKHIQVHEEKHLVFEDFTLDIKECENTKDISELSRFLKGNSKKDLIVLTRNPVLKWISGVTMDIRDSEKTPIFHAMLEKHYGKSFRDKEFDQWPDEVIADLAYFYVKNQLGKCGRVDVGHGKFFNEQTYNLFTYHKDSINLNKLRFFDLDNLDVQLSDIILEYYPELKPFVGDAYYTQRTTWVKTFGNFFNYVSEYDGDNMLERIQTSNYRDYHFYQMTKKVFKENHIN